MLESTVDDYSVSIRCRMKDSEKEWAFTGVCGPCDPTAFGLLREDLCKVHGEWKVLWCVGGDFNVVRCPAERLGMRRMTHHTRLFNAFIQELSLVDIPLGGACFTWTGNQGEQVCSILDRFLFTMDWMEVEPRLTQETLPNLGSDHTSIILRSLGQSYARRPFRFDLMWLEVPGFIEKVKEWWEAEVEEGSTSFMLGQHLKLLKEKICRWRKQEFGEIEVRKVKCLGRMEHWQQKEMVCSLNEEEKVEKRREEEEYNRLLRMEEISWRQKSRVSWLKEGDQNTKFFHKMATWRQSTNFMNRLKVEGEWVYDQDRIGDIVEHYYIDLYNNLNPIRPILEGVTFDRIEEDMRRWLERPFSEEEVLSALNSMEDDKAPGLDGFPPNFLNCVGG